MSASVREVIVVRSLADSDLGIFAAHRASARSKQRAININSDVARLLLAPEVFERGQIDIACTCILDDYTASEIRRFGKTHKNWRLGGQKIEGAAFAHVDAKDFVLIRTCSCNDGSYPWVITFVARRTNRLLHAGLAAIVERHLSGSMAVFDETTDGFRDLAVHCAAPRPPEIRRTSSASSRPIPPMPSDAPANGKRPPRSISEKIRTPHLLERMFRAASDLSAPAQLRFIETVGKLASQLRELLLATGGILRLEKNHRSAWARVAGQSIAFVDGGLANLSMLGSAPIAARVGGYIVVPGSRGEDREHFFVLKHLIDELYSTEGNGVYSDTFPDIGALRDAARISIEAAGAVNLLQSEKQVEWLFLHGALVNPVSRYSDVMRDGAIRHRFPNFSQSALQELLPGEGTTRSGRDANFISVYLRQLEILSNSRALVCGVVERESTSISVTRAVLNSLEDDLIRDLLPEPPEAWKHWFIHAIDPTDDDDFEGQRITDSLLFRCVLEPGEVLLPVELDRNELRRAPNAWRNEIARYPRPHVTYIQVNEWSAPIRMEVFGKDTPRFRETAELVMHCALLLPHYAFPVGLDIVDKFAKIPNWMSRPINTITAVHAIKGAMDRGDTLLVDNLRRMLCGSNREFLLRPGIMR